MYQEVNVDKGKDTNYNENILSQKRFRKMQR